LLWDRRPGGCDGPASCRSGESDAPPRDSPVGGRIGVGPARKAVQPPSQGVRERDAERPIWGRRRIALVDPGLASICRVKEPLGGSARAPLLDEEPPVHGVYEAR